MDHYVGRRLSLKGQLCSVRYIGPVADKSGEWLGVEWDDTGRGKHDGTHNGKQYFQCRSRSATAASFLRPTQPWDKPRTFYQALREKYMPEDAGTGADTVYFSTKQAEEVGFEKFAKRQAALQGIHTLVLDHMCIGGTVPEDEKRLVSETCKNITQLDIGSNLFESLEDVLGLAELFPRLRHFVLAGNRLSHLTNVRGRAFLQITDLNLSDTLLSSTELFAVLRHFPRVARWTASNNELVCFGEKRHTQALIQLDLSGNSFQALDDLKHLSSCPELRTLILKHGNIAICNRLPRPPLAGPVSETIDDLDLAYNQISNWSFFDSLSESFPALRHLRVSGIPLFANLTSADGKPLTAQDGYMLTIARLPQLNTLNYSKITEKERLNAETYYLNQIAAELRKTTAGKYQEVISRHPRWQALCQEYGEPVSDRKSQMEEVNPNTLAARLVEFTFILRSSLNRTPSQAREYLETTWTAEIPKSFSMYALLGMVGKRLGVMPLSLRLIWETGEQDPIAQNDSYQGPEWWDSSDDEDYQQASTQSTLITREVELAAGTRAIGTYIEGNKARVRVEVLPMP